MTDSDEHSATESRSERLRRRRSNRTESTDTSSTATETAVEEQAETDVTDPAATTVKDEQVGTYMYVPESQKQELERMYNVLKAEYEYEYETTFEKNRHFYPLLIQYGLDGLESFDITEIQNRLDSM